MFQRKKYFGMTLVTIVIIIIGLNLYVEAQKTKIIHKSGSTTNITSIEPLEGGHDYLIRLELKSTGDAKTRFSATINITLTDVESSRRIHNEEIFMVGTPENPDLFFEFIFRSEYIDLELNNFEDARIEISITSYNYDGDFAWTIYIYKDPPPTLYGLPVTIIFLGMLLTIVFFLLYVRGPDNYVKINKDRVTIITLNQISKISKIIMTFLISISILIIFIALVFVAPQANVTSIFHYLGVFFICGFGPPLGTFLVLSFKSWTRIDLEYENQRLIKTHYFLFFKREIQKYNHESISSIHFFRFQKSYKWGNYYLWLCGVVVEGEYIHLTSNLNFKDIWQVATILAKELNKDLLDYSNKTKRSEQYRKRLLLKHIKGKHSRITSEELSEPLINRLSGKFNSGKFNSALKQLSYATFKIRPDKIEIIDPQSRTDDLKVTYGIILLICSMMSLLFGVFLTLMALGDGIENQNLNSNVSIVSFAILILLIPGVVTLYYAYKWILGKRFLTLKPDYYHLGWTSLFFSKSGKKRQFSPVKFIRLANYGYREEYLEFVTDKKSIKVARFQSKKQAKELKSVIIEGLKFLQEVETTNTNPFEYIDESTRLIPLDVQRKVQKREKLEKKRIEEKEKKEKQYAQTKEWLKDSIDTWEQNYGKFFRTFVVILLSYSILEIIFLTILTINQNTLTTELFFVQFALMLSSLFPLYFGIILVILSISILCLFPVAYSEEPVTLKRRTMKYKRERGYLICSLFLCIFSIFLGVYFLLGLVIISFIIYYFPKYRDNRYYGQFGRGITYGFLSLLRSDYYLWKRVFKSEKAALDWFKKDWKMTFPEVSNQVKYWLVIYMFFVISLTSSILSWGSYLNWDSSLVLTVFFVIISSIFSLITLNLSIGVLSNIENTIPQDTTIESSAISESELSIILDIEKSLSDEIPIVTKVSTKKYGLKVQNEFVSELGLSRQGLKHLPKTIGELSNLRALYLSKNQILSIPETIGDLNKLEILDLERNYLYSLPESISELNSLKKLNLRNNQLSQLPIAIFSCEKLEKLYLSENNLTTLPEEINQLENLVILDLEGNPLEKLPNNIINLKKLKTIKLKNTLLAKDKISIRKLKTKLLGVRILT